MATKEWKEKNADKMREYRKTHYKKNKEQYYKRNEEKKFRLKLIISKVKSSGCKYCGELESCCLDFHHLRDKKFNISQMSKKGSLEKLLEEISKCEIVCSNCHRKIHAGIINTSQHNGMHQVSKTSEG